MRKIIILTFFAILLIFAPILASGVEITVPTSVVTVYINKHNSVNVTVTNTQNTTDSFLISVWPAQWIAVDQYGITLAPNETKTVMLSFDPPRLTPQGVYEIGVMAKSKSASDSKMFLIDLTRNFELFISDVKTNSQVFNLGDNLITNVVVTNLNTKTEKNVIITTNILKNDLIIQKFDDQVIVAPSSAQTVSNSIDIKNTFEVGSYKLKIELKDVTNRILDEKEITFVVRRNYDFSKDKATEFGLFYLTTKVTVTNKGNVPDATYTLTESLPSYFKNFFYPDIEPKTQQVIDSRVVYTWEITGLKPGQSATILYQIRFTSVVVAILSVGLVLYVFNYFYFKPNILKKHSSMISQPKEELVSLHVKNRSRREIKNIIVKDYVPPLARVVKKFDSAEPEIRLTTKGTALTWKIDKISPHEERILTYRIIPVMEIPGGLRLPKAHFIFEGKKHIFDQIAEKIVQRNR